MKRLVFVFSILLIIILGSIMNFSYAYEKMYTLEFEASDVSKSFDLYLLLPKDYIEYAIRKDGLDIKYKGVETLKDNDIPSINIENKNDISDELYEENGIEYIQILLKQNEDGKYVFDILEDYADMDMKFRIKNVDKDYIVHIDNFKISDNVCKIEYNYDENTVKQPDTTFVPFLTKLLIILLAVIIVIGAVAYIKQRR